MKKQLYRTRDLYEAAFLYASNSKLLQLENENNRKVFIFEEVAVCRKLTDSYWRKEALINAKAFSDAIKTLKDLIFNK
ncbi:DUF5659 domain-containing protein [bacterium]|jgi:hypothetical protein|nr:DUF5659 domain-containing protein [bacterium]